MCRDLAFFFHILHHLLELVEKLLADVAEYINAGFPLASTKEFISIFLTEQAQHKSLSGITQLILETAVVSTRREYSELQRYVWYISIAFDI
jgi:hypothetical protein